MIYLLILNIILSSILIYISYKKPKESKVIKVDLYKDYRDPITGLLRSRKVKNL